VYISLELYSQLKMATENSNLDQSVIPVEQMNAQEVTETSSDLNISLTARERLMKKLQGISAMVTALHCFIWCNNVVL